MIPAPPLYPRELVSCGVARCCLWFKLPFKRFARKVLGVPDLRLNFLNLWPLRPLESLFNVSAEDLLWKHTVFPYATAFLSGQSFDEARKAALDGGSGMPRLLAAMQNVSGELVFRRFCPRCLEDSIARHGESYWDRSHNLPGVFFCPQHRCALVATILPARSTLKTIYDLPIQCTQSVAPTTDLPRSNAMLALARSSRALLERQPGPGEVRDSGWYRELAVKTGWLTHHRDVNFAALQKALRATYHAPPLEPPKADGGNLGWAPLLFRPATSFRAAPLKHLLVETMLTTCKVKRAALDYVSTGPSGTSSQEVDAFYAPKAKWELRHALARGEVLTTKQFLRRSGALGPYRHRAEQLPALRKVILEFRSSPASVKPLRSGSTLFRNDPTLRVPHYRAANSVESES
jgi:hypothetical protein